VTTMAITSLPLIFLSSLCWTVILVSRWSLAMFTWWFRTHKDGWMYMERHEMRGPLSNFVFAPFCTDIFEIFWQADFSCIWNFFKPISAYCHSYLQKHTVL
jgi:hypothetical protein